MRFANPSWLVIGGISVVILLVLLVRAEHKRTHAIALLMGARILPAHAALPSQFRRWLRVGVVTFAVAMGFGALARPQRGTHWETVDRKGIDLLLVVDTSKSMDADDVKPSRLGRVKLAIRDLVDRFPGDRIGLVAFAGDARVQSPMTLDHAALLETVDALDTSIIARGGTNIGRAIDVATVALASEPGHQKAMVLLSDGEDLEGEGLEEGKKAEAEGIIIDTVGVGSAEGEIVPAKDDRGRVVGVVRDEAGNAVRSRLDETGLRAIAASAHGTYRALGVDGLGLDRLYKESLAARAHVEASSRTRRVYSERFEIPLGLALIGIALDALLGIPWRKITWKSRRSAPAAAVAALLLLVVPRPAHASAAEANKAYAAGRFEEAAKEYEAESAKNPKDARLAFNAGDAAYKAKQYDAASAAFKRALTSADPKLQEHVLYNQGDSLYRAGEGHKIDARPQTIEQWKAAVTAYEGALALEPADADARFNRDFVKRKLAELEEKQKQEDKQKQDEKQKQDDTQKQGGDKGTQDPKDGSKDGKGAQDPKDPGKGQGEKAKGPAGKGDDRSNPSANGGPPKPAPAAPGGGTSPPAPANEKGDQPGLSPRDARALLGALRGEEHRGAARGADAGISNDDPPRKDW